jgi:hypothetical protein
VFPEKLTLNTPSYEQGGQGPGALRKAGVCKGADYVALIKVKVEVEVVVLTNLRN